MKCPICPRTFAGANAVSQHCRDKHHVKCPPTFKCEDEPSIASQLVDASLDRAMGLPVEDWLADMLPEE